MIVAFELQTYQGGLWKIDSMFDDRQLALMEAQRLGKTDRYSAVRVVEENYNPETQATATKIIYRTSRVTAENDSAIERKKVINEEVRSEGAAIKKKVVTRQYNERKRDEVKQTTNWLMGLVLKGGGILLVGIGALVVVHMIAQHFQ